ncbi:unnamed protein product [Nyctereutes procyonoides]|uniref:(raccoon dog) hypothetical protein n=1 Tax=Nyctereutes procyonoides TaxID=34880 RepID=A0A811YRX2_NYCPR|nr:unnamed protein product [Nyctereutes procyonoides]
MWMELEGIMLSESLLEILDCKKETWEAARPVVRVRLFVPCFSSFPVLLLTAHLFSTPPGQTVTTPLSLTLDHWKEVAGRAHNLSVEVTRRRWVTFCSSEWPAFNVGWPRNGTFNIDIILQVKALVLQPGPNGHLDQPTWDDRQQLLQTLLTTEERQRVYLEAQKNARGRMGGRPSCLMRLRMFSPWFARPGTTTLLLVGSGSVSIARYSERVSKGQGVAPPIWQRYVL